jgi:hypothetical protein
MLMMLALNAQHRLRCHRACACTRLQDALCTPQRNNKAQCLIRRLSDVFVQFWVPIMLCKKSLLQLVTCRHATDPNNTNHQLGGLEDSQGFCAHARGQNPKAKLKSVSLPCFTTCGHGNVWNVSMVVSMPYAAT